MRLAVVALMIQLATVVITDVKAEGTHLVAHATVGAQKLRIAVELDPASGKMAGLLFQPDLDVGPKPTSFEDAQATRRDDDRWFVVTLGLTSDEGGTVDEAKFISVAAGVIELLGKDR